MFQFKKFGAFNSSFNIFLTFSIEQKHIMNIIWLMSRTEDVILRAKTKRSFVKFASHRRQKLFSSENCNSKVQI